MGLVIGLWLLASPMRPWAHPLDPALLELRESGAAAVEVLWRVPLLQPSNAPLSPVLPSRCHELSPPTARQNVQSLSQRWRIDCGGQSLVGESIGVEGLNVRKTDALVRIHLADGRMALVFGFLHGLGFAGALAQVGLPTDEIPLALFSFNVGIELGQILFVGLVLAGRTVLHRLPMQWPKASQLIPAYVIGSLAALWIFERIYMIV